MNLANLIILLSMLLALSNCFYKDQGSLIDHLSIQKTNEDWVVKLICKEFNEPCTFNFLQLPQSWLQKYEIIKIPLSSIYHQREYSLKVHIRDWKGKQAEEDIKLKVSRQKILLLSEGRIQNEENQDRAVPINQYQTSLNQKSKLNLKDEHELSWLERNGISSYLPTIAYLDKILASADSLDISKTLQNIISDDSDCSLKSQYLSKVDEELLKHINENQEELQHYENKKLLSSLQIQKLKNQREKLTQQLEKQPEKPFNEDKSNELTLKRDTLSVKSNSMKMVAKKYLNRLLQLKSQMRELNSKSKLKEEIKQHQTQLEGVNEEIQKLLEKQKSLENKISQKKNKLENQDQKDLKNHQKIISLEEKYEEYQKMANQYEKESNQVQNQLEKMKSKPSIVINTGRIRNKIDKIDRELQHKTKFDRSSISKLQTLLDLLSRNRPKISKAKEQCQTVEEEDDYSFQELMLFQVYPRYENYGFESNKIPAKSQFYSLSQSFQKINIFSSKWVIQYGVPTTYHFNCDYSRNYISGYGMIKAIEKGSIRVKGDDGSISALYLGGCSYLEGISVDFIPKIGDVIEWEGDQLVRGVVNLHNGKIYRNHFN